MSQPARLLTSREVAEMLNVSVSSVSRWVRNGEIPAEYTPGGQLRIREEDARRLLRRKGKAA